MCISWSARALQEILNVSTQVRHNGEIVPLDDTMLRRMKRVTDTLNRRGCAWWRWPASTCPRGRGLPAY